MPSRSWSPASVRSHPRFSLSFSARFHSSSPVFGERATTTPRMRPSTGACGAAMTTSASPSPEMSGTGITQWPKSPSERSPSHARISAPVAPDHTMALPLWNVPWSLNRAPAATSATPSPSASSGSPKRNPSSPRATSPGKRRARHQPAPGVVQDGMVPAELGSADEQHRRRAASVERRRRRPVAAGDATVFTDSSPPSSSRRCCTGCRPRRARVHPWSC